MEAVLCIASYVYGLCISFLLFSSLYVVTSSLKIVRCGDHMVCSGTNRWNKRMLVIGYNWLCNRFFFYFCTSKYLMNMVCEEHISYSTLNVIPLILR